MSGTSPTAALADRDGSGARWSFPLALVVAEYAALSLLVDFPTSGPAMPFVAAARMLVPAVVGGGAAGWLVSRGSAERDAAQAPAGPGARRPWIALAVQLGAFAATALFATRLFGSGASVGAGAFALWLGGAAATFLLALPLAAPPAALLRAVRARLGVPLVATCVGLLSWRAVAAAEGWWGFLQAGTLRGVAALLRLVTADVVVEPSASLVGAGGFEVAVAPVCSGVDGLGLVLVFQAVWVAFARTRVHPGRALLLVVPAGAAIALAANVARIAALVLLGASGREDLAMGAFHSKLGWLLFVAIALASVAAVEHAPWVRRRAAGAAREHAPAAVPNAAGAWIAPLLAALVVALGTSLWAEPGLDRAYGLRIAAALAALLLARRSLPAPSLSPSSPPVLIGAATALLWIAWPADGHASGAAIAALGPAERAAWLAARLAGSCLVLPVVEELAFRGFLLRWLVATEFEALPPRAWTVPAVLLSSLAFGALHAQWVLGAAAGLAFAAARLWRGRLGDAILAHAVANAGIAAAVLLGGRWDLWS